MALRFVLLAIHLTTFVLLFRKRRQMVFYLPILLSDALSMVSLVLIEAGAFITEEGVFGYENGAFYIFFLFAFSTQLFFFIFSSTIDMRVPSKNYLGIFLFVSAVFMGLILYAVAKNPGLGRFNVFAIGPVFERFANYFASLYVALFTYGIFKEPRLKVRILYLAVFVVIEFAKGGQFSGYFVAIVTFYAANLLQIESASGTMGHLNPRQGVWVAGLFGLFTLSALYFKFSQTANLYTFLNRFILSDHLFWAAVNLQRTSGPSFDTGVFWSHFFTFQTFQQTTTYGLGQLMYAASGSLATDYLAGGARFSGGYPSILIFHFGYLLAYLMNVFFVLMFVGIMKLQMHLIRSYGVIVFILFSKLSFPFVDLFTMGEYSNINMKTLLLTACAILLAVAGRAEMLRLKRIFHPLRPGAEQKLRENPPLRLD